MSGREIAIAPLPADFADWDGLLALIRRAFAFMDGVVDPPSSIHGLSPAMLARKAEAETVFAAWEGEALAGCLFTDRRGDHLYCGRLAVEPRLQGKGIGRRLIAAAEALARREGLAFLELQTRVELARNQQFFGRLGFAEVGRTAHAGFARPTSITLRKALA